MRMAEDGEDRPLAVIDIDGVLADVGHRLHFLDRRPKDWKGFFAAARADPPHPEGLALAAELAQSHEVILLTGRPEGCRADTETWLGEHGIDHELLVMRPPGNRRPAAEVKVGLLATLAAGRIVGAVVDDDPAVVAAVEAAGYPVHVATWGRPSEPLHRAQEVEGRT